MTSKDKIITIKKKVLFFIVTFLTVFVFLEIVLNLFVLVSPRIDRLLAPPWADSSVPRFFPDEVLGYRPNPAFPEHDTNGFRNPKVPTKADVVALGDSQTYGTGVNPEEAWPKQLEPMIAKTVYSMAFGGYGPVHSLIFLDEAFALKPKIIIEAFYAGNDLFDSFNIVYNLGQFNELKSHDPQVQNRVRETEKGEPIKEYVSRMFKMGYLDDPSDHTKLSIRKFFSDYSKVYGLLRRFRFEFRRKLEPFQDPWVSAKESAGAHPAYTQIFNNGQFRTIFTPQYRFSVLNLKDPRILEGFKISLRAIKRMNEICRHKDIRFLVVLIPTKELVFSELPNNPSGAYNILTDSEVKFRMITKDFFERNRIEYLDVLPALLRQLDNGNQPYKVSWDGHPNEKGHSAIARLIRKYLKENIFGQNN